jgi:hypothetical protein
VAMTADSRPNPLRVLILLSWACIAWSGAGVLVWASSVSLSHSVEEMLGFGLSLGGALGFLFASLFLIAVARSRQTVLWGDLALILNGVSFAWFWLYILRLS